MTGGQGAPHMASVWRLVTGKIGGRIRGLELLAPFSDLQGGVKGLEIEIITNGH